MRTETDPAPRSDTIVSRAVRGDAEALDQLVTLHRDWVFGICRSLFPNYDDAEEATQQVLANISSGIGAFRGDSELRTWMYRIVVNVLKDFIKRRSRRPIECDFTSLQGDENEEEFDIADPTIDVERNSQSSIILDTVRSVCEGREWQIILYRYKYGKTLQQVGKMFGISGERVRQIERQVSIRAVRECKRKGISY